MAILARTAVTALTQVKVLRRRRPYHPHMTRHPGLLIVIADGAHARFVRVAADGGLHTASSVDSAVAQKRASDLISDRPGAAFHSNASAHHALSPRSDPHAVAEQAFARLVAAEIGAACDQKAFDELLLAAPPRLLNVIRDRLGAACAARLVGTLGKDLTKTPDDALRPHLRHWLDAPPRAG